MPDFAQWRTSLARLDTAISPAVRATSAWIRITRDPIAVQFQRDNGGLLAAQTVRVGIGSSGAEVPAQSDIQIGVQSLAVYGVRDHPDTSITDTDMQRGDRFMYNGKWYEITGIVEAPGEVQGFGEVRG